MCILELDANTFGGLIELNSGYTSFSTSYIQEEVAYLLLQINKIRATKMDQKVQQIVTDEEVPKDELLVELYVEFNVNRYFKVKKGETLGPDIKHNVKRNMCCCL
ncbi:hypothetical protein NQ317_014820 [Molorchus minor]|uniref:Uncharacterized protein n=1 Tax=Molorchus minor TaxID=1323400 RepID=A0ABQ9IWQ5_9CUCU|nr:hypothetical protein NQ317_014820 [Molorchus minor]